jgi:hypothetical protein
MGNPSQYPLKSSAAPFSHILPLHHRHNCTHRPRCFKASSFQRLSSSMLVSWIVRRALLQTLRLAADQWNPQNHIAIEILAMHPPTRLMSYLVRHSSRPTPHYYYSTRSNFLSISWLVTGYLFQEKEKAAGRPESKAQPSSIPLGQLQEL